MSPQSDPSDRCKIAGERRPDGGGLLHAVFDEYRYDALGRRVLVRSRCACDSDPGSWEAECRQSKIRRVVWDGSEELYEISVNELNPGTTVERDLCLTISVGMDAAAECGDLRVIHELPSARVLGRARTPTLFYNSDQAAPYPLVRANVMRASCGLTVTSPYQRSKGVWSASRAA